MQLVKPDSKFTVPFFLLPHDKPDVLFWLICLVFATIPVAPAPKGIAMVLLMVFWLFSGSFWTERGRWMQQDWLPPLLLIFFLPWVGLLWSVDVTTGLKYAQRSVYWLYAPVAATISYRRYGSKFLVFAFLSGLFVSVGVSVLQYVSLIPMYKAVGYGLLNHITYSLLIVAGLLFLAYLYREYHRAVARFWICFGMLLLVWNLSVGISRAGYLAFILAIPWMAVVMFTRKQIVVISVCCVLAISALALSPVVQSRLAAIHSDISQYQQGQGMTSIGLRFHMWKGAIEIWRENPVLGVGTGGYRRALMNVVSDPKYAIYTHPHNSLLYMAVSYGIVGVCVFVWLIYLVVRRGWLARATMEGRVILVSLFIIGVGSLTDTQIMGHATGLLLGLVSGLPVGEDELQAL
jgi:O-antigen ligase